MIFLVVLYLLRGRRQKKKKKEKLHFYLHKIDSTLLLSCLNPYCNFVSSNLLFVIN
jgi:hypothetical protein